MAFLCILATGDRQTGIDALSRSRCRERRLNNLIVHVTDRSNAFYRLAEMEFMFSANDRQITCSF